jgi:phytanoyl-CoA hydroxylase
MSLIARTLCASLHLRTATTMLAVKQVSRCSSSILLPNTTKPSSHHHSQSLYHSVSSLPALTVSSSLSSLSLSRSNACRFLTSTATALGGASRRNGHEYQLTQCEIEQYHRDGFIVLADVMSEAELEPIEKVVDSFIDGKYDIPGADYCDMSKPLGTERSEWSLVNAMLPRVYDPSFADNLFERRCASISRQLLGTTPTERADDIGIDFDQILAKKPSKSDAVFAMHADLAYWPVTQDTRTATISLALDPASIENGCLKLVRGSHLEPQLRPHYPMPVNGANTSRDDSHTLVCDVDDEKEDVVYTPVGRGGVTVHNELIVHGSGGNTSDIWRRTYIVVHRALRTIAWERERGFTHSHNDDFNWDKFHPEWLENAK